MDSVTLSIFSALLYLGAAGLVGLNYQTQQAGFKRAGFYPVGMGAVLLHAVVLQQQIIMQTGLNLGFFNAFSLITWVIALLLLLLMLNRPVNNLAVILFPIAALGLGMMEYFQVELLLPKERSTGFKIHVVSSILAYSLLCLAAFQAIFLAVQDYQLRHKHPLRVMRFLPPLQVMEELLIQSVAAGFILLSLALLTGFMFLENMLAQRVVHHTVLSILAWLIFALLLWGRLRHGWRGRVVVNRTLLGFFILMLAYFGSKFVLEILKAS